MSEQAKKWAMKIGGVTASEKLTLVMIADSFDDEKSIASIPLSDLAVHTCMSKRNLHRVIKSLKQKSLIDYKLDVNVVTNGDVRNVPFRKYQLPVYEVSA